MHVEILMSISRCWLDRIPVHKDLTAFKGKQISSQLSRIRISLERLGAERGSTGSTCGVEEGFLEQVVSR